MNPKHKLAEINPPTVVVIKDDSKDALDKKGGCLMKTKAFFELSADCMEQIDNRIVRNAHERFINSGIPAEPGGALMEIMTKKWL